MIHEIRDRQTFSLGPYKRQVEKRMREWEKSSFARRLMEKDPTLWFADIQPELEDRLGWLDLPKAMLRRLEELEKFAHRNRGEGIISVVLLGMGGSSLAPEVFQETFGNAEGYPELVVLDSTHPGVVQAVEKRLDLSSTLFLVSSKSGTTLETLSLFRYFWSKVGEASADPGRQFAAITDPDTPLERLARERGFKAVFQASPDVGGRYSAFSVFGMVPAVLIGVDASLLLKRGKEAAESCVSPASETESLGLGLGAVIGELAKTRDKLTIHATQSLRSFPDWLEQLIAESTGKDGKGIVPVVDEPRIAAEHYGRDRAFVGFFLAGADDSELENFLNSLEFQGHPVIRIVLRDKYDLGQEIFHWEVAVASAGSLLGIHPFNQPDVQLAKDLAHMAMQADASKVGSNRDEKTLSSDNPQTLKDGLEQWLAQVREADYIGIQAYLAPEPETTSALQSVRRRLLERTRQATTMGYGPRFLHSTGQLHKGGPSNGLFLQIVDEPDKDVSVPEQDFTFGQLLRAQAWGDYEALKQRNRQILRLSLGKAVAAGLARLEDMI